MKLYQLLLWLSRIGVLTLTIQILFFKMYFSPITNKVGLYFLILFLAIFPIAKILERRAFKKHENKHR